MNSEEGLTSNALYEGALYNDGFVIYESSYIVCFRN